MSVLHSGNSRNSKKFWSYSVEVITFGFDPDNPGSNPGRTSFFAQRHLPWLANQLIYVFPVRSLKQLSFFFSLLDQWMVSIHPEIRIVIPYSPDHS